MKGDIALAGFVLTAAEWEALDAKSRSQLVAAAIGRDEVWIELGMLDERADFLDREATPAQN